MPSFPWINSNVSSEDIQFGIYVIVAILTILYFISQLVYIYLTWSSQTSITNNMKKIMGVRERLTDGEEVPEAEGSEKPEKSAGLMSSVTSAIFGSDDTDPTNLLNVQTRKDQSYACKQMAGRTASRGTCGSGPDPIDGFMS